jgi:hypothetical protein
MIFPQKGTVVFLMKFKKLATAAFYPKANKPGIAYNK